MSALTLSVLFCADIIEIELTEDKRLRSSRIKKEKKVAPSAIIAIMIKTRRVSFSFCPERIATKISVITKHVTLPKQHINPITNAGETG